MLKIKKRRQKSIILNLCFWSFVYESERRKRMREIRHGGDADDDDDDG